jgi:sugar phosphate isomerase/epimerase
MYPALGKSYKGLFPFKIGTTSFIYPDNYVPNVEMLGPYLEDIELLLFESNHTEALPSRQVIADLLSLANDFDLSYNVHLPTDISVSSRNPDQQLIAVDTVLRVMELIETLAPSTLTLHVPYDEDSFKEADVKNWQERVFKSLEKILAAGIKSHLISIENLDYPFEIVEKIICDLDLSICLDLGHLIVHNDDIQTFFNRNRSKISIIHLYGVDKKHYHKGLNQLPRKFIDPILDILKKFKRSVSLEVFSFNHLDASLKFLEKHWRDTQSDD